MAQRLMQMWKMQEKTMKGGIWSLVFVENHLQEDQNRFSDGRKGQCEAKKVLPGDGLAPVPTLPGFNVQTRPFKAGTQLQLPKLREQLTVLA